MAPALIGQGKQGTRGHRNIAMIQQGNKQDREHVCFVIITLFRFPCLPRLANYRRLRTTGELPTSTNERTGEALHGINSDTENK